MSMTLNLALGIYFGSLLSYAAHYLVSKEFLRKTGSGLLFLAWLAHSAYIAWRWIVAGYAPVSNMYESLIVLSWAILVLYFLFLVTRSVPRQGLGFWAGLSAIACLGVASLLDSSIEPLVPALRSNWLLIHVVITLLGYAALALAAIGGGIYLACQGNKSRENRLALLDGFTHRAMSLGFLLLALGVMTGAVWANSAWGTYWSWDPKETWSLVTWFVYLVALHLYKARGWRDSRFAWAAIVGFVFVIFTYFGVNYLLSGLHSYA